RLENAYQQRVFENFKDYARKYSSFTEFPSSAKKFASQGGAEHFLREIQPSLKAGTPPFVPPRRLFQKVELPSEIKPDNPIPTIAQALKPYLRGQTPIQANGQQINLSAAILIPKDFDKMIVRPNQRSQRTSSPDSADSTSGNSVAQVQYWSANASDQKLR